MNSKLNQPYEKNGCNITTFIKFDKHFNSFSIPRLIYAGKYKFDWRGRFHFRWDLTLNCIRYPALPLVHNGGFHGTPQRKPLSHWIFLIIFTPYLYTLITTIFQEKKYKYFVPFQNGGQIINFHFASFRFRPKFEKPLSQRNCSMKFGSN